MPTLTASDANNRAQQLLQAMGANENAAQVVGQHLIDSQLMGHDSHGMIRLPQYYQHVQNGTLKPDVNSTVERPSPVSAVVNGQRTWGQVVAGEATDLALQKAKDIGMASVCIYNCYHIGRVGAYVEHIARQGFIGKVWCNGAGVARMAPWGGTDAKIATNPMAMAVPYEQMPLFFDLTTTVVAEGKVRVAKNKGVEIPEGWVLDNTGRPSSNPNDLYDGGTILPLGGVAGHKGYALAVMVDLLAGVLSGAGCGLMPNMVPGNGVYLEVINPELFIERALWNRRIKEYIDYLKSSAKKDGVEEIFLPGEPEYRTMTHRREHGLFIDDTTWGQLSALADELNVAW